RVLLLEMSSATPSPDCRVSWNPGSWVAVTRRAGGVGCSRRSRQRFPCPCERSSRISPHVTQPILAEEDLVADEESRCSEGPARDRTLRVGEELVLDLARLEQLEESLGVQP